MRNTDEQRLKWGALVRERLPGFEGLHSIVRERIARQAQIDVLLEDAMNRVGREASQEGDALRALHEASDEAARRARLIALKLETAQLEGSIPAEAYGEVMSTAFPRGPGLVGGTPAERHQMLQRIASALERNAVVDPDERYRAMAHESLAALERANELAKKEAAERQQAHEALGRARVAWDDGYLATREILSGLLRDAGRRDELGKIFPDAAQR